MTKSGESRTRHSWLLYVVRQNVPALGYSYHKVEESISSGTYALNSTATAQLCALGYVCDTEGGRLKQFAGACPLLTA
jgi:hypothetical protein